MKGITNVSFASVLIITFLIFECINSAPVQRRSVSQEYAHVSKDMNIQVELGILYQVVNN